MSRTEQRVTRFLKKAAIGAIAALIVMTGCDRDPDEQAQLPEGHPPLTSPGGGTGASGTLIGEARAALDSGNVLYRAKAYDLALAQYRRAAALAPSDGAPLFGIMMVARATNDTILADSVTAVMQARGQSPAHPADSAPPVNPHAVPSKTAPAPAKTS